MSAVVEPRAPAGAQLPLLRGGDAARAIAWRDGKAVAAAGFLADVAAIAAQLPERGQAINLCEDRYAFLAAFCAVLSRGQTNLLAGSRAPAAINELLAAHPGSYALSDAAVAGVAAHRITVPDGSGHDHGAAVPLIDAAQTAAVGYTSGSTGTPRAHAKTWGLFNATCAANLRAVGARLPAGVQGHIVATVPAQHMYGIELSVLPPLLGPFAVHAGRLRISRHAGPQFHVMPGHRFTACRAGASRPGR